MTWGPERYWSLPRPARQASRIALALAVAIGLASPAQARERVTVAATAQATIVTPLSVVKVQDISFGRIVARPTSGTVTVDRNTGQCAVTGAILDVGKCQFAAFAGMGARNMTARISLAGSATLTGPGQPMVFDNIALGANSSLSLSGNGNPGGNGNGNGGNGNGNAGGNGGGNGAPRYAIASPSGIFVFNVGGRLNVNANQAPGLYNGTISVTVQYQ